MGYRVVKKSWQDIQPFWYRASVWRTVGRTDRQTDGRTDRRTDVQTISITCFSIADARKNGCATSRIIERKEKSLRTVPNSLVLLSFEILWQRFQWGPLQWRSNGRVWWASVRRAAGDWRTTNMADRRLQGLAWWAELWGNLEPCPRINKPSLSAVLGSNALL